MPGRLPVTTRLALLALRVAAYLIDYALRALVIAVLLLAVGGRLAPGRAGIVTFGNPGVLDLAEIVVANLASIAVLVGLAWRFDGQTPGKMVVRVRARTISGEPFGIGVAVWREGVLRQLAGDLLPFLPFGIGVMVLTLDFAWAFGAPEARMLHDYAARTYVNETRFDVAVRPSDGDAAGHVNPAAG
jgi:uncharacterized RDD family membrane protein YckC